MIREARDADLVEITALRNEVMPYLVSSVEGTRAAVNAMPEWAKLRWLVAEVDGRLVGWARAGLSLFTPEPGAADVGAAVLPEYRGRGIGSALLVEGVAHVKQIGAVTARGRAFDEPGILRWAERHGFAAGAGHAAQISVVDPRAIPGAPACPGHIRLVSFDEVDPRVVYDLEAATGPDIPAGVPLAPIPYEDWLGMTWGNPDLFRGGSVVALDGDVPVAYTLTVADLSTGRSWTNMTGTLRSHRGLGLAKIVKVEALHRSARAGITRAYTGNDATNAPMLAVNDWLGYQRAATQVTVARKL
ncbi:phosphinothricin acetyltransferase [Longispora fulva]|uniref:GNAT superfamily N-acetyltransferase n=1 Tax=Longispora fulva TaxID=619741 RepID=A0A8J7GUE3_9ACTN|nr:GNAT family N-acetyltransferase [Longispora fulva]MBG6139700.1 GNAT superfamily N-acetyltransferase [Longispora fulva]GIG57917.1 phosphinothricin acetyltransferase [Longispora fulva]